MRFRVLRGRHVVGLNNPQTGERKRVYYAERFVNKQGEIETRPGPDGDVVETNVDLAAIHNVPGLPPKFLRLEDKAPPEPQPAPPAQLNDDELEAMTLQELREFAGQEGVDVASLRSKQDVLQRIRGALLEQ